MTRKLWWALALLSASASAAGANTIPHLTKAQLEQRAALIVIGRAEKTKRPARGFYGQYQTIRVLKVLKGSYRAQTLEFLIETPFAERNPMCCEVGTTYRFYLERTVDDGFASISAFYGVVKTSN